MEEERTNKKLNRFTKIVIGEVAFLLLALVISRGVIFPRIAGKGMWHIRIATEIMVFGLTATIFTTFAVFFKREWRKSKKYIAIPAIFTVFGY
ncbi:MAG: hypothetical protein ACI3XA_09205, partial [Clostridia bacterium]